MKLSVFKNKYQIVFQIFLSWKMDNWSDFISPNSHQIASTMQYFSMRLESLALTQTIQ